MTQQGYQNGVARVNNTELSYDMAGAGHPLTLVHGMLLDRSSWNDQIGVFARHYTVMRYDLRGWGDSAQEQAEPPFSPRQDLLGLLEFLNIQQPTWSASRVQARSRLISPWNTPREWTR